MITIQDNVLITGGNTNSGDTYGIRLINVEKAKIFRNIIIGGTISGSSGSNYGISFENEYVNTEYNSVFNNFIVGGRQTTSNENPCYGVYISKSKIKLLNNTIDAGGSNSCITNTYGIYVKSSDIWEIDPIIINNYIIGGNGTPSYGIYLAFNELRLECAIFNNIFNTNNLNHLAGTIQGDANTVEALNGPLGGVLFDPQPFENLGDNKLLNEIFNDYSNNDYHIILTDSPAKNNGYNGSHNSIYSEEGAMYDIDGAPRPEEYNLIDLGADEFGD
ncbi:MAG: hypothetical protein ACUVWJ_09335 [Spirochaetota bacterium]